MTLMEKFLKDFPNSKMLSSGTPVICPSHLGYTAVDCGNVIVEHDFEICKKCWEQQYEPNEKITIDSVIDVCKKQYEENKNGIDSFDRGWGCAFDVCRQLLERVKKDGAK